MENNLPFRYTIKLTSGEVKQYIVSLEQMETSSLHGIIYHKTLKDYGNQLSPSDYAIIARDRFTGKKTKSGTDIYENDVLGGYPHGEATVKWNDEWDCFECISEEDVEDEQGEMELKEISNGLLTNNLLDCGDAWEVIGNTHLTTQQE